MPPSEPKLELHEVKLREGFLSCLFVMNGEMYGGEFDLRPYIGRKIEDISPADRERFVFEMLFGTLKTIREIKGAVVEREEEYE
jgi:hypothetical protein